MALTPQQQKAKTDYDTAVAALKRAQAALPPQRLTVSGVKGSIKLCQRSIKGHVRSREEEMSQLRIYQKWVSAGVDARDLVQGCNDSIKRHTDWIAENERDNTKREGWLKLLEAVGKAQKEVDRTKKLARKAGLSV